MSHHLLPPLPRAQAVHIHSNSQFLGSLPDMGSASELTQVVSDLVGIPEIFHAEANDINEILHEPEQLLGIWPYLQREAGFGVDQILDNSRSFSAG